MMSSSTEMKASGLVARATEMRWTSMVMKVAVTVTMIAATDKRTR
jgi:hypothetical protein